MSVHPVCNYASLDSSVIYHDGRVVSLRELLQTVYYLSKQIPEHQHLLNLYEERYYFLLGFLLGLKKQSIGLFPSSVTSYVLVQLKENYDDILLLSDARTELEYKQNNFQYFDLKECLENINCTLSDEELWAVLPNIELSKKIAIIFTSGSTGQPKPYSKQWNDLIISSQDLTAKLFKKNTLSVEKKLVGVIATVPAQHMYGMEASIILPLQNGFLMHSRKPFFPQDITQCLEDLQNVAIQNEMIIESTVITTPLHLKACVRTQVDMPGIKRFISATAPLSLEIAQQCENQYSVPVMEIFGCTEVGSIACRRVIKKEQWSVLKDIQLEVINNNDVQIKTLRSIKHFIFNDVIELIDATHFILKGRKDDLINVAGKRTSLAYLNHHIQSYNALTDAYFYQDVENKNRLVAFVVLKTESNVNNQKRVIEIRNYLKQSIESIFLPKKIYFVDSLPRNATGKLPQSEIKDLLSKQEDK